MTDPDRPNAWVGYVRQSPRQVSDADGLAIVAALEAASANPVEAICDHGTEGPFRVTHQD
jgi:hypothetical protein